MPANRKGPSAPSSAQGQPSSSGQPVPRSTSKSQLTPNTPPKPLQRTPKSSTKRTKLKAQAKKPYLITSLAVFVLQFLALYALLTCPTTSNPSSSPLCRSVLTYKHNVLDPYILPVINHLLSHPVAQPYVQKAHRVQKQVEPYVLKSVAIARPAAEKVGDLTQKAKIISWDGFAVPQFNKHVLPQYQTHLAPHIGKVVALFDTHVAPRVSYGRSTLNAAYDQVQPYISRVYGIVKPFTIRIWLNVRPYLVKFWRLSRPHLLKLWQYVIQVSKTLAGQVGQLKKEYVDVHVNRIWEKAAELSRNGNTTTATPSITPETEASTIQPTPTEDATSVESVEAVTTTSSTVEETSSTARVEEPASVITPSNTQPVPTSTESPVETLVEEPPSVSASTVDVPPAAQESQPTETVSPIVQSSTVLEASPSSTFVIAATPSTAQQEDPSPAEPPFTSSSVPEVPSSTPVQEDESDSADEMDLDDIFGDLDEPEPEPVVPEPSLSEEELVELRRINREKEEADAEEKKRIKKENTAIKRKDVMARHTEWEEKLEALTTAGRIDLRKSLQGHRERAADTIFGTYEDETETSGSPIRAVVDGAAEEGEKLLVGVEGFLKKTVKSDGETAAKLKKWDKALTRVKERFTEILTKAQEEVFVWYTDVRGWEIELVLEMEKNATDVAGAGQTDVGLDYVWLDDVRTKDWKRYHNLMRNAKSYGDELRQIQNGTHSESLYDPIVPAMSDLQSEMENIIQGFQVGWQTLGAEGREKLTSLPVSTPVPAKDSEEPTATEEPTLSILPISPSAPVDSADQERETVKKTSPEALVGRGAAEVEDALRRAAEHVEL